VAGDILPGGVGRYGAGIEGERMGAKESIEYLIKAVVMSAEL
jgi:hypothetical protein